MAKTRSDCVAMAHRRLGLLSVSRNVTADQIAFGGVVLDAVFEEVKELQGLAFAWTTDTVPDAVFLPLSYLLSVEIAPHYEVAPRDNRAQLIGRLRTYGFPDDRDDRRDLDDDGTITDAEIATDARAVYY